MARHSAQTSATTSPSLLRTFLVTLLAVIALALPIACAAASSPVASATGDRVLVLNSPSTPQSKFSSFTENLAAKGFQLTWRNIAHVSPKVTDFDERQFDHIVVLGTEQDVVSPDVSPQSLVTFAKDGGNIVFAFDSQRADWFRDLAREFAIDVTAKGESLVDHFNYAQTGVTDDGSHSTVFVNNGLASNDVIFSPETHAQSSSTPLLFGKTAAHKLGGNPQVFPLVKPSTTSYTAARDGSPSFLGTDDGLSLISAFQLKENSARVAFIGSVDFLSDDYVELQSARSSAGKTYTDSLNAAVLNDLTLWTFQSHGVLKVTRRSHHRVRTSPTDVREAYEESADGSIAKMYRIKDTVVYGLDVAQFDARSGGWIPAPRDLDMQVKLVMIDPFITTNLTAQSSDESSSTKTTAELDPLEDSPPSSLAHTLYTSTFTLPDRLGVYTFHTRWSRTGWTFINVKDTTPIRAFNHDENPRYLPASWPYVAASASTIAGFLLLTALWLFTGEKGEKVKTQ